MNWLDSALDAAGDVASSAGEAASSGGSWWDTGIKYGTKAFDWLDDTAVPWIENNPSTAKLLAGVAGGVGTYMSAREQRKAEEDLLEKRLKMEKEAARIVPGRGGNSLGVNANGITRGLISHGLIANPDDKRTR